MTVSKCALAGIFTGLVAALAVVIFNIIYRNNTGLLAFAVIVPVSSFLMLPLINLLIGLIYFILARYCKNGRAFYRIIVILTMSGTAYSTASGVHRTGQPEEMLTGMVFGIEIIEGSLAALLLPYLADHPKTFLPNTDSSGRK